MPAQCVLFLYSIRHSWDCRPKHVALPPPCPHSASFLAHLMQDMLVLLFLAMSCLSFFRSRCDDCTVCHLLDHGTLLSWVWSGSLNYCLVTRCRLLLMETRKLRGAVKAAQAWVLRKAGIYRYLANGFNISTVPPNIGLATNVKNLLLSSADPMPGALAMSPDFT